MESIGTDAALLLRADLDALRARYADRVEHMNRQSVWLFLATLGCWGVSQWFFKLCAYLLTAVFFAYLSVDGLKQGNPAPALKARIKDVMASSYLSEKDKMLRKVELDELEDSVMSPLNLQKSGLYWLSFAYFSGSMGYFCWSSMRG